MGVPVARASADLRLLRAAVFTAACVALSSAGHVLAAGATLPVWTFGVATALVFALALPLAGRERSLPGIAAALTAGQVGLHLLFSTAQDHPPASGGPPVGEGGLAALARSVLCNDAEAGPMTATEARRVLDDAGLGPMAAAPGPGAGAAPADHATTALLDLLSWPMLGGHLLAALAAGWLLRRGDTALWRLLRLSVTAVDGLLLRSLRAALAWLRGSARAVPAAPGRPVGSAHDDVPAEPQVLRHSVVRRGPPDSPGYALAA
ncbi:hypothetical protein GCM10023347_05490 [Streptomyces chumphonensis]|uniref:Integral membrane protein n=1 Tax=Streptomyces chumphonensis TaxID=1214925 RepID=A0A927IBQ3_9ACTN|nr:hypothetical protein [Streptomyces chumphonensis]MBD3933178.1 hypothetical protein [Streptomyces chumphonensis]